jgi:hypothetical protein
VISELESTDVFEMNYDEYKLNEVLGTGQTVIESYIIDNTCTSSANLAKSNIEHPTSTTASKLKSGEDFLSLSLQIFKYSTRCLEQPKLHYSILVKVEEGTKNRY